MKTVHDILNELDPDKLLYEYLELDPVEYIKHPDEKVRDVIKQHIECVRAHIERMRNLPAKAPDDNRQGVLYVYRTIDQACFSSPGFGMTYLDKLLDTKNAPELINYGYWLSRQEEIVGYLVADTPLTQHYIYELMAYVLNEAFFCGYEQEGLDENVQKIEEAVADVESGNAKFTSFNDFLEDLGDEQGFVPDKQSEDEESLLKAVMDAVIAYTNHSMEKELLSIRNMLLTSRE